MFENFSSYLAHTSPLAYAVSFLGGVAASFTPCVYPLIPVLVGVIGAEAAERRVKGFWLSLIFVLGMAVTYSLLGVIAALTGQIFGQLTSHPAAHFLVGVLCLFFGLSMLGLFEIRLPGRWGRARLVKKEMELFEVFLMGAGSSLVAAPCTVPVLGVLLTFVAQSRNVIFGFSLLFVFALGLGFLLVIVGSFTGLVASLPRSGPWLLRIKQGFGLVLVGSAVYFFIQAVQRM